MTETTDVVIVGAGYAGLAAGLRLAGTGVDFTILEARDRVGGRVLNADIGDGKVLEVGGQWIGPTQDRFQAMADDMAVETYRTHGEGDHLIEFDGKLKRYRGLIPRLSPAVLLDFGQAQARLDRMARRVPLEAPWLAPKAADWDSQTFHTWINRNVATKAGRAFMRVACEAVWACDAADVSLLHILFYIRSAGNFDNLIGTENGAQQRRFVGGSQLVALRAAERLGDRIALERPVRRIEHSAGRVRVVTDDGAVEGRRAIVTVPPPLAARIAYDPPLPAARDQLTQRLPMGAVIKCMAIYDEPFWRADGLTGQAASARGPVKAMFDNTPPDGSPGVLLGFLEGRQARELGRLSQEQRMRAVVECFARIFGPRAARPRDYIDKSWMDEEYTRGCYGAYFPPNVWTDFGHALRPAIGPIHWAGAETATKWMGYIDGAIREGERAADEIVSALAGERAVAAAT